VSGREKNEGLSPDFWLHQTKEGFADREEIL
jgi:hypothetical protein